MQDIYDTTILCDNCKKPTEKGIAVKEGFQMRAWKCLSCGRQWFHPGDMAQYEGYMKLRQKNYEVKLRLVGNSWAVSIPKDIIQFEEVHATKTVQMSLDQPGKVTITFTKVRRINNPRG